MPLFSFQSPAAAPDAAVLERRAEADLSVLHKFADVAGDFAVNLVIAVAILIATYWAATLLSGAARRTMARLQRRHPDPTLQSFVGSLVRYVVVVVGIVAVLQRLGVQTTSIIAVLGAASIAVGLALQGTLSNVAAGVMILILRPYRVGDVIEAAGRRGAVRALDLFVTELATVDNLKVVLPNSKVFGDVLVNYSAYETRRGEVVMRLPAAADLDALLAALEAAATADPRVLPTPAPVAMPNGQSEAWVEAVLHFWAKPADLDAAKSDITRDVRRALSAAGS